MIDEIRDRLEGLSNAKFALGAVCFVLAPLSLMPWSGPTADGVLALVAASGGGGALAFAAHRRRIQRLPLQLGERAFIEPGAAGAVVRVRVWLGRGRRLRGVRATAEVLGENGERRALEPLWAAPDGAVGPAVLLFRDPGGGGSRLRVEVLAEEGGVATRAAREWPLAALSQGRFAPGVTLRSGRCEWARGEWDAAR